MFRIFYAQKDATLYESVPNYNTGIDEILEISKQYYGDPNHYNKIFEANRPLLKDADDIFITINKVHFIDKTSCK